MKKVVRPTQLAFALERIEPVGVVPRAEAHRRFAEIRESLGKELAHGR